MPARATPQPVLCATDPQAASRRLCTGARHRPRLQLHSAEAQHPCRCSTMLCDALATGCLPGELTRQQRASGQARGYGRGQTSAFLDTFVSSVCRCLATSAVYRACEAHFFLQVNGLGHTSHSLVGKLAFSTPRGMAADALKLSWRHSSLEHKAKYTPRFAILQSVGQAGPA
jgi:hypothetical protein